MKECILHRVNLFVLLGLILMVVGCQTLGTISDKVLAQLNEKELLEKFGLKPEFLIVDSTDNILRIDNTNRAAIRQELDNTQTPKRVELVVILPFINGPTVEVVEVRNHIGYIDYDIELGNIQELISLDSFLRNTDLSQASFGVGRFDDRLWAGGVIPYVIDNDAFSDATLSRINQGIQIIDQRTNLTIIPRTNQDEFIRIVRNEEPNVSSSPVGNNGDGNHYVRIGANASASTVVHEFLHTAGVYHEQSRSDRDDFVFVNFACIEEDREYNFRKRGGEAYGPYDFSSIMHYGSNFFIRQNDANCTFTIRGLNNEALGGSTMTMLDSSGLVTMYNSNHGKDGTPYLLTLDRERDVRTGHTLVDDGVQLIEPPHFPNDELYGIRVRNIPVGAVIRIYDQSSNDNSADDWTEILVKHPITDLEIYDFERNSDSHSDFRIAYNPSAGSGNLNGKVSRIEVDLSPASTPDPRPTIQPRIILHEGNNGTQDFVGTIQNAVPNQTFNFTTTSGLDNDEARSMTLFDVKQGTVIRVFDNSDGNRADDWAEIVVKRDITRKVIGTFERSFEDADVRVVYIERDNLDGKVSRLEIRDTPTPRPRIVLREGNNGTQDVVGNITNAVPGRTFNFPQISGLQNDEARSLILHEIPRGTVIRLFDNSNGSKQDDWAEIVVKRFINRKVIGTFERSFEDADVRVIYFERDNLDGKVSRLEIRDTPTPRPRIVLREGNNGTQDVAGNIPNAVPGQTFNFTQLGNLQNDQARSLILHEIPRGTVVRVFDNSSGSRLDDWAEIIVKRDLQRKVIGTFERSFEDADVRVIYFKGNNLDGKVSRLEIKNQPTGPLVAFYSGTYNRGQIKAVLPLDRNYNINCKNNNYGINNDDITYLKLYNAPAGTRIFVFDSNDDRYWHRRKRDDWTEIRALRNTKFQNVSTFERTVRTNPNVLRLYYGGGNLNGKISYIQIRN
jgi:hypothetical protein